MTIMSKKFALAALCVLFNGLKAFCAPMWESE